MPAGPPAATASHASRDLAFASYLRVAAMSGVVLIHTMSAMVGNGDIRGSATWWGATALDLGVSWSVPIFIMVSGALLLGPRQGEGARAFYARRLQRIAIPLVVAHVGYLLIRGLWLGEQLTPAVVVRDLLRADVFSQLYFFWIILGLYMITPLLRPALAERPTRDLLLIGGALLLGPRQGEGARAFYARRLQRIAIPLVVAHVGYLLIRGLWLGEQLTPTVVVRDLLRADVFSQLYFFWIILGLYLITPLLRPALAERPTRDLLVIGVAMIVWMWAVQGGAVLLTTLGTTTQIWRPDALTLFIPYIGYFVLGYALRDLVASGGRLAAVIGLFVVANVVVVLQYGLRAGNPVLQILAGGGYQGLPVAITAVTLFVIARSVIRPSSVLATTRWDPAMRHLGELSLGVFIVHLAVLRLAWGTATFNFSILKRALPLSLGLWVLVTVASFALCAAIARIPVIRRAIGF